MSMVACLPLPQLCLVLARSSPGLGQKIRSICWEGRKSSHLPRRRAVGMPPIENAMLLVRVLPDATRHSLFTKPCMMATRDTSLPIPRSFLSSPTHPHPGSGFGVAWRSQLVC